jgi:hypothetical protein
LRSRLKAELISERLEGTEPSEVIRHDPELSDLERLSVLLTSVSRAEPLPSREAENRMRERVMECHRQVLAGEKTRGRDPSRRVSVQETWKLSYATLAAAAVIAVIFVVSSLLFTAPGEIGVGPNLGLAENEAWVFATGNVEVRPPGGEWSEMETPVVLTQGSSIRTPGDVRAEVAFGGENSARLNYGSEADILATGDKGISIQMRKGEGYYRAAKGTSFRVLGGGLETETLGTVFDLDLGGNDPELLALESSVEAGAPGVNAGPINLQEGKMLDLPGVLGEDGLSGRVRDIPPERLQEEWLLWNRSIDESRGLNTGVMAGVEPPVSVSPEITRLGAETPPDDNGDNGDNGDEGQPGISLQGKLQDGGISLTWELRDGTAERFAVLRATDREPTYSRDELAGVAGDVRAFLDREIVEGVSYKYRIAIEHDGGVIYSNAVVVTVPQPPKPTINLSGRVIDGGKGIPVIELVCHVEGPLQPDYYTMVRSEMNQPPVYPPYGSMLSWQFAISGTDYVRVDSDLYMGYTYNYRVYAIKGGSVIQESNLVSLYVDTTVILEDPGR